MKPKSAKVDVYVFLIAVPAHGNTQCTLSSSKTASDILKQRCFYGKIFVGKTVR